MILNYFLQINKLPSKYLTSLLCVCLLLISTSFAVEAKIVLKGEIAMGDNNFDRIIPTYMLRADGNDYYNDALFNPTPVNPIHFNLTEDILLKKIKLEDIDNTSGRLYFVIWDSRGNVVVNARSHLDKNGKEHADNGHAHFDNDPLAPVSLAKGDYRIAIVGQCFSGQTPTGWSNNCRSYGNNYDDFEFEDIKLETVSKDSKTESFMFIERRHIGDSNESPSDGYAGRWYPDRYEDDDVKYEFKPLSDGPIDSITIYNYRDLLRYENNVKLTLKNKKTGVVISQRYLRSGTTTGDYIWSIKRKLKSKNTYELRIDASRYGDDDDISWDDIVIKFEDDTPPPAIIDHYRLTYSDRALTCEPAIVTVQACTNAFQAGSACVESSDSTSVTLVANAQNSNDSISKPSGTFTRSTDINLGYLKEDDLSLSLTSTSKPYKCNGTNNCDINFADTGFFFSYDNADGSENIANQVAAVNFSKPIKLEAFYNKNGQCKNIFKHNEEIKVELGVQCQEPDTCAPAALNLNFVADTINLGKNSSTQEQRYSPVDLKFNNNITQINSAQYQDAGKINLIARYTINDNRNDLDGLTIKGQSNQFAVSPARFKIKATRHEGQNGEIWTDLTAQDNNALKYTHKAGDIFTFKIQALNANQSEDTITANYIPNSNDNLSIKLTRSMPTNEQYDGEFTYATNKTLTTSTSADWIEIPDLPAFENGVYRFVDSTYSEVGAIQINVKDKNYYGMKFSVDATFSDNSKGKEIGRFIPAKFELVSSTIDNYINSSSHNPNTYDHMFPDQVATYVSGTIVLQPKDNNLYQCRAGQEGGYCYQWTPGNKQFEPGIGPNWEDAWVLLKLGSSGITYMDQPELEFDYQLEAQNRSGSVTRNYDGDEKAIVNFVANADGLDLSHRLQGYGGEWCDGVYQPGACNLDILDNGYFSRKLTGPDGPIMNTLFGIGITDKDGVKFSDLGLPIEGYITARQLSEKTSELRYGRWSIADGYGPMSNDFAVTMQLEYFNGTNFITHSDDDKTGFDSINAKLVDVSLGGTLPNLSGDGTFNSGVTQALIIAAPNRNGEVQLDYTVDDWFKYKWEEGHTQFDQSPSANIVFGFFYGNDRVIYRRRLN
ncbi:hypothetical protein HWV00_19730 [Moritella sp. 24]|uniref:DUF6701 domain-containing protein n=1 Tax=Moritella sp. 24 TaxID=2746230 RepID=UPI001BAC1A8C|nr:DUF6701 domain-containing protein [Moritella sp. 24]QUM78266.1 hypothetical protein HWV00_19730 [Moritella sp. 24]